VKRAIITGADGFVGSHTVRYFLERGVEVLALDIARSPQRLEDHPRLAYRAMDVSDAAALSGQIEKGRYDAFVHFAWAGSAGEARVDYTAQMRNALTTVECLKAAKSLGCERFVCAGSIMEREVEAAVHAQGSRPGLGYIYGMGKLAAHCLCKPIAAGIGIDLIWPMITNAYGVGEVSPRFVNTTLRKILRCEPLQFTAATQNYDFIYVTDVARAFYLIAENGRPFCEYVIGSGNARPLRAFISEMIQAAAPDVSPLFGDLPFTGTDLPLSAFDASDTMSDCGFQAEVSFAEGALRTMEWLKTLNEHEHG
jgi:nucleoside-diphosphate-sugar epimerase